MKKYTLCLHLIFSIIISTNCITAQGVRGAEIIKSSINQKLNIRINVYREGEQKDSILVFWGDGQEEFLQLGTTVVHSSGIRIDAYGGAHTYDSVGYIVMGFDDEFLVDEIVNVEDSWQKGISMRDSVYIFPEDHPFDGNFGPEFSPSHFLIHSENGVITHPADLLSNEIFNDDHLYSLIPFPTEDYSFPEASESIMMEEAVLVWDRPIGPGTYAVCIKVKEMREDVFDEFSGDFILMSTTHRAMMIDVDSSMIVSSPSLLFEGMISVFPNPANEVINIQWAHFKSSAHLRIIDLFGREMYTTELLASNELNSVYVPITNFSPGIYLIVIKSEDQEVIRKVIVE